LLNLVIILACGGYDLSRKLDCTIPNLENTYEKYDAEMKSATISKTRSLSIFLWHFVLKIGGAMTLFWLVVGIYHHLVYEAGLDLGKYFILSLLIPAAFVAEVLLRRRESFRLCHRCCRISSISQREILFVLIAILLLIIISQTAWASRLVLATFFSLFSLWVTFMNSLGHRIMTHLF